MTKTNEREELYLRKGELANLIANRPSMNSDDLLDDNKVQEIIDHEECITECKKEISFLEESISESFI